MEVFSSNYANNDNNYNEYVVDDDEATSSKLSLVLQPAGGGDDITGTRQLVGGGNNIESSKNKSSVDDLLNSKLNKMSLEERSSGLHDLHGVAPLEKESADMIRTKLREMDLVLSAATAGSTHSNSSTFAYEKAVTMSLEYVQEIKLKCLRAECYHSQNAVDRLVRHFARKLDLFGEEKLVREITQQDLDPEDTIALNNGLFQILPQRDRSGRVIVMYLRKGNRQYSNRSALRVLHYMVMSSVQEEESQRRGIVVVGFGFSEAKFVVNRPFEYMQSFRAIPARVVALHSCRDDSNQLDNLLLCSVMQARVVSRFRRHIGTPMECMYALMTFGIPRDAVPANDDGQVDLSGHRKMLNVMKNKEEEAMHNQQMPMVRQIYNKSSLVADKEIPNDDLGSLFCDRATSSGGFFEDDDEALGLLFHDVGGGGGAPLSPLGGDCGGGSAAPILVPGHMDILMGRGRHPKSRPGSLRLHHLLLENRDAHDKAKSRLEKTAITKSILQQMKALGCRFLQVTEQGYYVECDDCAARDKIAHGFRNLRLKGAGSGTTTSTSNRGSSPDGGAGSTKGGGDTGGTNNSKSKRKREVPC